MSADQVVQALARILGGAKAADCESVTLDFKEDVGSKADLENSITKASICFANSAGGSIVVGVSDRRAGLPAFTGTSMNAEHLRQRIHELTKPALLVDIEEISEPKRLLIIKIPATGSTYSDNQGRSWHRIDTDCLPLTPIEQGKLAQERSGFDWSAEPSEKLAENALTEALTAARLLLTSLSDERRELARRSDADLLSALGVLADRNRLNRAGALMFCASSQLGDGFVYQYKITPAGEPRTVQRISLPLLLAFSKVMELISARQSTTPVTMSNGQQITIEDFPLIAVREALSNAICHRDWQAPGLIAVDHAPEVFSVTSPGPLVSGVTPQNILTMPSRPRNRCLTNAIRILGLAEETGRGVDRMYRETIRSGRRPPNIEGFPDRARVSFVGGAPDTNIARFVARLPEHEREDTDTMLVIYTLCGSSTITSAQIAPILQKPPSEALTVLRRLSSDTVGLLETTRHSAGRSQRVYRLRGDAMRGLGSAVAYNRRTIDETDRKIIEHVREYGKITNRTLQNLFDIHVFRARDIITGLQQRGVLTKISEQTRGSKVEWGAGPDFPKTKQRRRKAAVDKSGLGGQEDAQTELPLNPPLASRERS